MGSLAVLLDYVPQTERSNLVRDLLRSLKVDDQSGLRFVASLIEQDGSNALAQELASFLANAVNAGDVQPAVDLSLQHEVVRATLLIRVVEEASKAKLDTSLYETVQSWLRFATLIIPIGPLTEVKTNVLLASLELLQFEHGDVHKLAREVVLEVLLAQPDDIQCNQPAFHQDTVWSHVQSLVASKTTSHIITGYSIWLRWLLSVWGSQLGDITTNDHWQLIMQGLKRGDAERRKLCLNILKLTSANQAAVPTAELREQYHRYATVFETIVLGRYMNQVLECERDLDFFASNSVLNPSWLFTLLGAALDNTMQDSNRKFIGNWVLSSMLRPEPSFMEFFQNAFLPWAIQGQHFVATLKYVNGRAVCGHGEQLADFIKRLEAANSNLNSITDIVVETLLRKKNSMFAYCTVYLLEGLGNSLSDEQKTNLESLRSLPEVARDYVATKTSKPEVGTEPVTEATSVRRSREQEVFNRITSLELTPESLDDVWGDVEYLEFPKKLLMVLPAALLEIRALNTIGNNQVFAYSLTQKLEVLQQVATTKTFLFSPLIAAVRRVVYASPAIALSLNLADFIIKVAEQPPIPTIDLRLEEAIVPLTSYTYEHYYGERVSYGFAAYLDLVSRLRGQQALIKTILHHILHQWKSQKIPTPVVSTWKNMLQLQVLFLCFEQYQTNPNGEQLSLLDDLFHILAIEPLPKYRYLLEAIVVRTTMRYELGRVLIDRLQTKDHHSNPKHLASLMKVGAILACAPDTPEDFAHQIATAFVPLAASSKVVIRHESQWQVPLLMDHARAQGWTTIAANTALIALDDYIRSLERFHDPPEERQIGKFDPTTDITMTNVVEGRWMQLDQTESPLTTHADFVKLRTQEPLCNGADPCIPLGSPIAQPPSSNTSPHVEPQGPSPNAHPPTLTTASTALQTKGIANLARSLTSTITRASPHLFIVASLLDNPHNLGGLSRVSEIFGAGALTLPNTNITSNKDFLSVSVSSHLHIPIHPLPAANLPAWLRKKRREGYIIVGIEQTDRSVVFGSTEAKLPEKCVLVVGNERAGVPGEVLIECDVLVEIEQRGVTRSLNVQTAVACVGFEYCRQHGKKG